MKKWMIPILILLLIAVPVSASTEYVVDDSELLQPGQVGFVEDALRAVEAAEGFTPVVVTIDSFGGLSAEEYAGNFYDAYGYGRNGILLLVSLEEGQWYILTNGLCAERISDYQAEQIGQMILPMIRDGAYYDAFILFSELCVEYMQPEPVQETVPADTEQARGSFGKGLLLPFILGLVVSAAVMGYLAARMKPVGKRGSAADYVQPGSMEMTDNRDIFLYSNVTRTPKPKPSSGGSSGMRSSGGPRGGAGGRI